MTQDTSSRNTKEELIDATHKFLRAMAAMFWAVAGFFAIVRMTSSPGSPAKSSAWLTNDALVWPTIILLIATGIGIWQKKKWGAVLSVPLSIIWVIGLFTSTADLCVALPSVLTFLGLEVQLLWLWREKQLTW